MKKNLSIDRISLIFLIPFIVYSCSQNTAKEKSAFIVAVAANAQFAIQEMITAFEKETGTPTELVISSSGKITAQISQGAPYAVFLSSNMRNPDTLIQMGKAVAPNHIFAQGELVVWTTRRNIQSTQFIHLVNLPFDQKIAVANPKNAPYGAESINALKQADLFQKLSDQLIFGESISQTNQYILSGAAAIGLTAKSVVLSPQMNGKGRWSSVPDSLYLPVRQGLVITKHGETHHYDAAHAFVTFIFSEKGKTILEKYGYIRPTLSG